MVYDYFMSGKVLGYVFIALGILVMIAASINLLMVFTKHATPVQLFTFKPISINTNEIIAANLPAELSGFMQEQPANVQKTELISAEMINDSSNIFAHLLLVGFFVSLGYKFASLGVMMVRPIVVKLKAKEVTTEPV